MSSSVTRKTGSGTLVIKNFSQITEDAVFFKIKDFIHILFGAQLLDGNVFVYLHSLEKKFKFRANVSILNSESKKLFTKEYCGEFDEENDENLCSLMPRSALLSAEKGYLDNDKLTLLCEFEVIEDEPKIPDTVRNDLSKNFQSLLTDGKYSDFTLIVGEDGKEFRVHKAILAARSPMFAAMFEHDCEEKRQNKVEIIDMDEDVCAEMLRFVYTGEVKGLDRLAMELLVAADKYQLPSLKSICSEYMCEHLSVESVSIVLVLADLHQFTDLKSKCFEYICANVKQVKSTEGWKVLGTKGPLLQELFIYLAKKK